jgi:hypothetical protein
MEENNIYTACNDCEIKKYKNGRSWIRKCRNCIKQDKRTCPDCKIQTKRRKNQKSLKLCETCLKKRNNKNKSQSEIVNDNKSEENEFWEQIQENFIEQVKKRIE